MPDTNTIMKGEEIWQAGDREVIENFRALLFPGGKETLPRNISSRCAEVWNGHHVAYRCLTCGISPSSCICVACFNAGEHEGHDYFIYRSDYGGCCDCGRIMFVRGWEFYYSILVTIEGGSVVEKSYTGVVLWMLETVGL